LQNVTSLAARNLIAPEPSVFFGLIASAFVVARDRGRRRRQERVETLFYDRVTFARCLLQAQASVIRPFNCDLLSSLHF